MKVGKFVLACIATVFLCCQKDEHHRGHETNHSANQQISANVEAPAANAVQAEMRLLTTALETAVRGIGAGDVRNVEHALHRVHEAKLATEAALEGGRYRLPKNADRAAVFHALDEAFHGELEQLVKASHNNDVAALSVAMGGALRACPECHAQFRP
jgi:cytochrome c556